MLNGMGIESGVDLEKLVHAASLISRELNKPLTSKAGLAMQSSRPLSNPVT